VEYEDVCEAVRVAATEVPMKVRLFMRGIVLLPGKKKTGIHCGTIATAS
jgi:hypothetical protein